LDKTKDQRVIFLSKIDKFSTKRYFGEGLRSKKQPIMQLVEYFFRIKLLDVQIKFLGRII